MVWLTSCKSAIAAKRNGVHLSIHVLSGAGGMRLMSSMVSGIDLRITQSFSDKKWGCTIPCAGKNAAKHTMHVTKKSLAY
jgi:hypothetical protein